MVLMLVPSQAMPREVLAVAYTLSASRPRVFWSVTLLLTAPGMTMTWLIKKSAPYLLTSRVIANRC